MTITWTIKAFPRRNWVTSNLAGNLMAAAVDLFKGSMFSDLPATSAAAVVPSDTADLAVVSRALWVGVAGNVEVIMADSQDVTFLNVAIGWMPIRASRVKAAGTTASGIVAVW